jgi:hypothetical protein
MTNRSRISKQNKKELRPASFAPLTEALAQENERYEACHRMALKLMEKGFHLGGTPSIAREDLHERKVSSDKNLATYPAVSGP